MKPPRFLCSRTLAALVLGCALWQPSCALLGSPGPSDVSQGRLYQSGHSGFDPLFVKVHALQLELGKAPNQEEQIRIALARELDLELQDAEVVTPAAAPPKKKSTPAAPSAAGGMLGGFGASLKQTALGAVPGGAMVDSLQKNAAGVSKSVDQLQQATAGISKSADQLQPGAKLPGAEAAGSPESAPPQAKRKLAPAVAVLADAVEKKQASAQPLSFELTEDAAADDEVIARVRVAAKPARPDSVDLAQAVEQATNDSIRLRRRMQTTSKQLRRLLTQILAADVHVDLNFRKGGPRKRAEVRKNLNDAASMIQAMLKRAEDVEERADELVRALRKSAQAPAASEGAKIAKGTQAPGRKAAKGTQAPGRNAAAKTKRVASRAQAGAKTKRVASRAHAGAKTKRVASRAQAGAKTKRVASRAQAGAKKERAAKAADDFEP